MTKNALLVLFLCGCFCVYPFALTTAASKPNDDKNTKSTVEKAVEFTLKDQFGNSLTYKFPKEKISILAFADKDGSEQLEGWIRPLYEKYQEKVDILGVAELSAVPSIAKGIVRSMIKKKSAQAVGLDWDGAVSKSYKYEKKKANLVIIDKQGNIVKKENGAFEKSKFEKICAELDTLLK